VERQEDDSSFDYTKSLEGLLALLIKAAIGFTTLAEGVVVVRERFVQRAETAGGDRWEESKRLRGGRPITGPDLTS
jgi:hypothetical protein